MPRSFKDLVNAAEAADVSGWDFSWFEGRATEERPPWGFQRMLGDRLAGVRAALDIQTGGGEVLGGVAAHPPTMVATESWPPNVAKATALLHPLGVVVVADPDEPPLPFAGEAFDHVSSRHPVTVWWSEIARVLRPGGRYLGQHVGPRSNAELYEFFLGPQDDAGGRRHPDREVAEAKAAGLTVTSVRTARLRLEFFDVGAVVYFLRKVLWTVPDFSVERHLPRLRDLHDQITSAGPFVSHSSRTLIEASKVPTP